MPEFLIGFFSPIQLIGYLGTACALLSYQCRKNRNYFLLQTGCALSFAVQFALLGSYAAMLLNIFSVLRGILFARGENCRSRGYLILMETCFAVSCLLSCVVFGEKWWIAALLFAAQGGGTLAMWTRNGKVIRMAQLCFISPIWIVNNICYFSVGGILCEVFNMISVVISFIRFGKTGYDKT